MSVTRRAFARRAAGAASLLALPSPSPAQSATVFAHGVASGDPLLDRVVLWTRISTSDDGDVIPVEWEISESPSMRPAAQRGLTYTNGAFDYTVKVDVTRLKPGATYYYRFAARGSVSPIGRTRTLPAGALDRLRFCVVSCSNYPYGFFNAYRLIAARADLDFVLHLGDYIYEYAEGQYGNGTALGRIPSPNKEIVTLEDYRRRYAQYRSDPDLQEVHRQHPFLVVWDDHESANDAWAGGAQNHSPETEGDWFTRRAVATQAWFEWLPVRENPFQGNEIYRTFRFGDLADLVLLDTRLAGRDRQVAANSSQLLDPNRTLLGAEQEEWFLRQLSGSAARGTSWRLVGQQVMMGQLVSPDGTPFNPDQWDGYVAARARLLQHLGVNAISNVVVLTGDIHSSWGNEITANPFAPGGYAAQAVEFVSPAVTSPGIDDRAQATALEGQIGATHPHVKFVDLFRRGYLLVDLDRDRAQAEWYHVDTITERAARESIARSLRTESGLSRLTPVSEPSRPRAGVAAPAP